MRKNLCVEFDICQYLILLKLEKKKLSTKKIQLEENKRIGIAKCRFVFETIFMDLIYLNVIGLVNYFIIRIIIFVRTYHIHFLSKSF